MPSLDEPSETNPRRYMREHQYICCPSELLNKDPTAQDPAARARTDEAPGSPTGEFVSGTAVSPYEFGTDAVQQYHSQYPKSSALPQALVAHPGGGG